MFTKCSSIRSRLEHDDDVKVVFAQVRIKNTSVAFPGINLNGQPLEIKKTCYLGETTGTRGCAAERVSARKKNE